MNNEYELFDINEFYSDLLSAMGEIDPEVQDKIYRPLIYALGLGLAEVYYEVYWQNPEPEEDEAIEAGYDLLDEQIAPKLIDFLKALQSQSMPDEVES